MNQKTITRSFGFRSFQLRSLIKHTDITFRGNYKLPQTLAKFCTFNEGYPVEWVVKQFAIIQV